MIEIFRRLRSDRIQAYASVVMVEARVALNSKPEAIMARFISGQNKFDGGVFTNFNSKKINFEQRQVRVPLTLKLDMKTKALQPRPGYLALGASHDGKNRVIGRVYIDLSDYDLSLAQKKFKIQECNDPDAQIILRIKLEIRDMPGKAQSEIKGSTKSEQKQGKEAKQYKQVKQQKQAISNKQYQNKRVFPPEQKGSFPPNVAQLTGGQSLKEQSQFESLIDHFKYELESKDKSIAYLNQVIEGKDSEIADLQKNLKNSLRQLNKLKKNTAREDDSKKLAQLKSNYQGQILRLTQLLEQANGQLHQKVNQIQQLKQLNQNYIREGKNEGQLQRLRKQQQKIVAESQSNKRKNEQLQKSLKRIKIQWQKKHGELEEAMREIKRLKKERTDAMQAALEEGNEVALVYFQKYMM